MRLILYSIYALLPCICSGYSASSDVVHEVRDVLEDLDKFAGKIVSVRGTYIVSSEDSGLHDARNTSNIALDGGSWPTAIDLRFPPFPTHIAKASLIRATAIRSFLDQVRQSPKGKELYVTIIGRLNGKDELQWYKNTKGELRRMGFGHLGSLPARIYVLDITDVKDPAKPAVK